MNRNPIEVLQHGQYSYESDVYRFAMTVYEFYTALHIHSQDPMADQLTCAPFACVESDVVSFTKKQLNKTQLFIYVDLYFCQYKINPKYNRYIYEAWYQ